METGVQTHLRNGQKKNHKRWSGRPGSNRRHPAWEAGVLPLNYSRSLVIDEPSFRVSQPKSSTRRPGKQSAKHESLLRGIRDARGCNRQTSISFTLREEHKMSPSATRKHAVPASTGAQPVVPEPTFSERARTLVYLSRIGSLSTLSRKQPGFPFGSVMPYALDERGRPIFLISTMAMHTQNLQADPRASLLITQPDASGAPLGASRVTVMGNVMTIPKPEVSDARRLYLERYANSKYWVDFEDFSFYRMDVLDVYYVGGFGVMGWVLASDYDQAQPDPLADAATGIIEHMNTDHKDALILLAGTFAGMESEE